MSELRDKLRSMAIDLTTSPISSAMFEAADALEARDKTITELVEALKMTRATVGDLRKGFASYVRPEAWVEQLQDYIDKALSKPQPTNLTGNEE